MIWGRYLGPWKFVSIIAENSTGEVAIVVQGWITMAVTLWATTSVRYRDAVSG